MNVSWRCFAATIAINAVVPILVGVMLYSFYIAARPMTMEQSTTVPIAPSPLVAIGHGLGLLIILLPAALAIFIIPSVVTSVLVATLVSVLPEKSKTLVFAVPFVLGSFASVFWLYYCTPARGGPISEMAPCAVIGYLISGTLTCIVRGKNSN
jgi:hypothetical protein